MDSLNHKIFAEFKPTKSGIFTLGSLLIAAATIIWGVSYIADEKYLAGFLLFIPGIIAATASYFLGFRSSKDQDLGEGIPFKVSANETGYEVSADPRTAQELLLSLISSTAQTLKDRKPLPEPSGMVGEDGFGDSNKKEDACRIIANINQECRGEIEELEAVMTVEQELDAKVIAEAPVNKLAKQ